MEINYANNKLRKQLSDPKELSRTFGQRARKIDQRHKELVSADNLSIIKLLPATGFHPLVGNRKGEFAVDVSGNYRLIFRPNHNPVPLLDNGGIDLVNVTAVTILDVEDYH